MKEPIMPPPDEHTADRRTGDPQWATAFAQAMLSRMDAFENRIVDRLTAQDGERKRLEDQITLLRTTDLPAINIAIAKLDTSSKIKGGWWEAISGAMPTLLALILAVVVYLVTRKS